MKASRNLLQRNDVRYDDLTSTNAVTGISTDCVASATGVESWETRRELEAGMTRKKVTWAILSKHDGCNSAQSKILQWKQGITARTLQAAAGIIFLLTVLWWHRLSTEASASELCSNRERTLAFFFFQEIGYFIFIDIAAQLYLKWSTGLWRYFLSNLQLLALPRCKEWF